MANRRQFLAGSVASSALMTSFAARAGTFLGGSADKRLAGFVFDARFEHGAAMAQDLGQHSTPTYAVRGDVSEVWYDNLAPNLLDGARAIGGLTTAGGLFVLARLGHDAGLTLALHGKHRLAVGGQAERHALDAPDLIKIQYKAALASEMPWASALRAALLETASTPSAGRFAPVDLSPFEMDGQTTLHSWLLVPRA